MIKRLLESGFRKFGQRYAYNTGYMIHVTDTSVSAGV